MADLIVRNARIDEREGLADVVVDAGRIAAIESPGIASGAARTLDIGGRYVSPGFVETHIHLDKSCIAHRCDTREGTLAAAIREVARAKARFTADDVHARAMATLERAILTGTTRMRTHVEVDPGIGLRGFDGVQALVDDYRWAIDLELCVFPQEGLTDNPGTDELLVAALRKGANAVGAAPYVDSNPHGQIDRIFAIARDFDVPIDMHLDFTLDVSKMDVAYVCAKTREHRYGGRVAIGHVSTLSALAKERFDDVASMLADAGVAVTVLPSTDLFLMGRGADHDVPRGVAPAHRLVHAGVGASLATNNVLNPFTPYGDCSLVRMANLYANIAQLGVRDELALCHSLVTRHAAALLGVAGHEIAEGAPADFVVLDCESAAQSIAEIAAPLYVFKHGRMTVSRERPVLHRP